MSISRWSRCKATRCCGLTIRRGTPPKLAAGSLRKIADLIERHGDRVLTLSQGGEGSFSATGDMIWDRYDSNTMITATWSFRIRVVHCFHDSTPNICWTS